MKNYILFLFAIHSLNLSSQVILPDSIYAIYYKGGDYRKHISEDDYFSGAYNDNDFVAMAYVPDRKRYISETTTHTHNIHPFEDGKYQAPTNKYSKLVRNYGVSIPEEHITNLLSLLDTSKYQMYLVRDTFPLFDETHIRIDTTYTPKDFSIEYYGIDSTYFNCFCEYYHQKIKKEDIIFSFETKMSCQNPIEYDLFLRKLIELGIEDRNFVRSSFTFSVSVELIFEDRFIKLYQEYPDGFKAEWDVYDSEKKLFIKLTNPKLNTLIARMIPSELRGFDNYQDKESLIRLYLSE